LSRAALNVGVAFNPQDLTIQIRIDISYDFYVYKAYYPNLGILN